MTRTRLALLLGLLLTALAVGGAAGRALAGPPDISISPGGTRFRDGHPMNRAQRAPHRPRFHGVPPRAPHPGHERPDGHHRFKRFRSHNVIVLPSPVVVVPGRCWTPGYWAYQWIPQAAPYHVWVQGYWSVAGTWVPGHYRTHYVTSGYYQPYWVDGAWTGC